MAGCSECKYYKRFSVLNEDQNKWVGQDECLFGNTSEMTAWWAANGNKRRNVDVIDDMACHEYHESTKKLDRMIELLDKMGNLLT